MSLTREQCLQQLGITQYILRRPTTLRGEVAVSIPADTRLVIMSDDGDISQSPLLADIIAAMNLNKQQIYCLPTSQGIMLPEVLNCALWVLGDSSLKLKVKSKVKLTTPSLQKLSQSAEDKHLLWQQIYKNEDYFTANT